MAGRALAGTVDHAKAICRGNCFDFVDVAKSEVGRQHDEGARGEGGGCDEAFKPGMEGLEHGRHSEAAVCRTGFETGQGALHPKRFDLPNRRRL